MVTGLALFILLQLFFGPLLYCLACAGEALEGAKDYLGILVLFYVFFQSLMVLLRNDGGAKLAMGALLLCSCFNVAHDALFIFGFSWELFGTGLAQIAGLLIALLHLRKAKLLRELKPRCLPPFRLMGKDMAGFVMESGQGVVIFAFNAVLLLLVGEEGISLPISL